MGCITHFRSSSRVYVPIYIYTILHKGHLAEVFPRSLYTPKREQSARRTLYIYTRLYIYVEHTIYVLARLKGAKVQFTARVSEILSRACHNACGIYIYSRDFHPFFCCTCAYNSIVVSLFLHLILHNELDYVIY